MQIWSAEIKELERLYESFKGQLPDMEKELERLVKADDENMILLYSRRCLEVIITELCECELKRPRKTEPLKGIIDKLNKEEKVPSNIITSMDHLNSLSAYGAHPKDFDPEQVKPVLVNLDIIIKWYLKYKDTKANLKQEKVEVKDEIKAFRDTSGRILKPKKRLVLLLSGLTLVVATIVVTLFVFNIIGGGSRIKKLEKSIAVLPFKNDSPGEEKMYFINGTMDAILENLCKIEDLRVVSRNSVEQYRDNPKPTPVVAKEMDVSYVLEGSGHRDGDNVRMIVQLLDGRKDQHLWSKSYDANIEEIFSLQSEIAQLVAREINAIITPQEQELIEKIPTTNQTAWDFYQQGKDEHWKYWLKGDEVALGRAENRYKKALEFDSEFAHAYIGLADVYWDKHHTGFYFSEGYLDEEYMDTLLILVNTALSYDIQLAEGYTLRGDYFRSRGKPNQALEEYDRALKYNPNDWKAYRGKGYLYADRDYVKMIDNTLKTISLYHGPGSPELYISIWRSFHSAGFIDIAKHYSLEAFKLDKDTMSYYQRLYWSEFAQGDFDKALEIAKMSFETDSNSNTTYQLGVSYMYLEQYEESLAYFRKSFKDVRDIVDQLSAVAIDAIAGTLWKNGLKEEARYYFNEQINILNRISELGRDYTYYSYDFASIYAFLGDREKAYEYLHLFSQRETFDLFHVTIINNEFLFDSIRDEPEFRQIARDIEAKYQAEHERVRKWLEENEML